MGEVEQWRPIEGYDGRYEVSSLGRIRSTFLEVVDCLGRRRRHVPTILRPGVTSTGYYMVRLRDIKTDQFKYYKLHRLVAMTFIDNPGNKPNINHIDNNPLNNRIENLEWCTQHENVLHAYLIGARKTKSYLHSKETSGKIIQLYTKNKSKTVEDVAGEFGIDRTTVFRILNRNGIPIRRGKSNARIDEFKVRFNAGQRNVDIAREMGCTTALVSTRRYQCKRGII